MKKQSNPHPPDGVEKPKQPPAPPKLSESTETAGYVTISMTDLCRMYAVAYHEGHHDTVEAQYTDVFPVDMDTYHEETVREFLDEL